MTTLNESTVEDAALEWLAELGYTLAHGPEIAPGETLAERDSFGEVVLVRRLQDAIQRTYGPRFEQTDINSIQFRTLATLRDMLLPKLLSGELSVTGSLTQSIV